MERLIVQGLVGTGEFKGADFLSEFFFITLRVYHSGSCALPGCLPIGSYYVYQTPVSSPTLSLLVVYLSLPVRPPRLKACVCPSLRSLVVVPSLAHLPSQRIKASWICNTEDPPLILYLCLAPKQPSMLGFLP